jgi:hypothetical protein
MPNNIRQQGAWTGSGDPESYASNTLYAPGLLGSRVTVIQPTSSTPGVEQGRAKTYQLVQSDSSMTTSPFKGAVAWWSTRQAYLVTTSATNINAVAGIFQNDEAVNPITKGQFCYVQVEGPASVKFTDASAAGAASTVGLQVIPSSTTGKAATMAANTAPTNTVIGLTSGLGGAPAQALAVVELQIPQQD